MDLALIGPQTIRERYESVLGRRMNESLSQVDRYQLPAVARMLYRRNFSPAAIFCAEDEASKQAAYRLYERLCGKGIEAPPPAARWQLNERDFGEMNGHTKEEALAQYQDPNQVEAWWLTDDAEPYGGESKSRVRQRVAPFLHQEIAAIRRSGSGGVLLITPPQVRLILDETIRRGGATACGVLPFGQGSLYQV